MLKLDRLASSGVEKMVQQQKNVVFETNGNFNFHGYFQASFTSAIDCWCESTCRAPANKIKSSSFKCFVVNCQTYEPDTSIFSHRA